MRRSKPGRSARGSRVLTVVPSNTISPALVVSIWAMMLSSVDLPAPEGPTMVRNSPSRTEKERSWITQGDVSRPWRCAKRLPSLRTSSSAGPLISGLHHRVDRRPPAQQQRFERIHEPVDAEHQDRRHDDGGEYARGVKIHGAGLHQIAEAAIGRDQLGDHGGADRVGDRDAKAS